MLKASCNKITNDLMMQTRLCYSNLPLLRYALWIIFGTRDSAVTVVPRLSYNGVQLTHIMICILKYKMENVSTDFLSLFCATRVRNLYPECQLPPPTNLQLRYQRWEYPYLVPSHRQKQTSVINAKCMLTIHTEVHQVHPLIELITCATTQNAI
jgi:hypothetical protein